jgi:adenylate cyclase
MERKRLACHAVRVLLPAAASVRLPCGASSPTRGGIPVSLAPDFFPAEDGPFAEVGMSNQRTRRNIEIKARLRDHEAAAALARRLSGDEPQALNQEDTFFRAASGRLKLRKFSDRAGELIAYSRPNQPGPKRCDYVIAPVEHPDLVRQALAAALPVIGIVRKTRLVFLVGQTRVHLDDVEGLGRFLELETVLTPAQSDADGQREAAGLLARLGVTEDDLISGSYIDRLIARESA